MVERVICINTELGDHREPPGYAMSHGEKRFHVHPVQHPAVSLCRLWHWMSFYMVPVGYNGYTRGCSA